VWKSGKRAKRLTAAQSRPSRLAAKTEMDPKLDAQNELDAHRKCHLKLWASSSARRASSGHFRRFQSTLTRLLVVRVCRCLSASGALLALMAWERRPVSRHLAISLSCCLAALLPCCLAVSPAG